MDEKRNTGEPEDAMMQQGYPSPTVDGGAGGPYYHTHKQELDHQLVSDEHHDGQDQHGAQDHTTPHQHQSRPSVSAEELQLAAQLTQGLAPIMAAHNQAQEGQMQAQEADMHGHEATFQDQSHNDHNLQDHLQSHLQNNEHNLQGVLPHVEQSPHYATAQPDTSHLQQHMPLEHMAQQYQVQVQDNIPPRKRSKVSRACDECRRKKIKCDAVSDAAEEPCSNCRRSTTRCLFSRIPQKRGPSKGYIKELADRIHSIEGKLGGGGSGDPVENVSRASAEAFSTPTPLDENRKRPFSSISGDTFSTPTASRHAGWASDPRPIQPYQSPAFRGVYSVNSLAPRPIGPRADGARVDTAASGEPAQLEVRGIDDAAFEYYLGTVHQAFPVLASDKSRVHAVLGSCPAILQEAFLEAFYAVIQQPRESSNGEVGDVRIANRLLADWEMESSSRSAATDLIQLQTLALMVIEADSHGPVALKGLEGGPSKVSILGRAVGLAYSMGLHHANLDPSPELDLDLDTDAKVALRAWWMLVVLDRWHAIGTATPTIISNDTVVIPAALKSIVGEANYSLIHLSTFLGNFVPMSLAPPKELTSGAGPVIGSWMNLALEGFRVNFPASITPMSHPLIHLAYWHCRLLSYLFSPAAVSTDILWAATEMVGLLTGNPQLSAPLSHHFSGLAGLTLVELSKNDKTREEASRLLKEMLELGIGSSPWDDAIRESINDKIRPTTSSGLDSHGLQHLADLATATTATATAATTTTTTEKAEEPVIYRKTDNYENAGFDPRPMLQAGYLNAFGPGGNQTAPAAPAAAAAAVP